MADHLTLSAPGTITTPGSIFCEEINASELMTTGTLNAETINATDLIANSLVINDNGIITSGLIVQPEEIVAPGEHEVDLVDSGENLAINNFSGKLTIMLPVPTPGFKVSFTFAEELAHRSSIVWSTGKANLYGSQFPGKTASNLTLGSGIAKGTRVIFWSVNDKTMFFEVLESAKLTAGWSVS